MKNSGGINGSVTGVTFEEMLAKGHVCPAAKIIELMLEKELTVSDYAKRANIDLSDVLMLLGGSVKITPKAAEQLELVFEVDKQYFLDLEKRHTLFHKKLNSMLRSDIMDKEDSGKNSEQQSRGKSEAYCGYCQNDLTGKKGFCKCGNKTVLYGFDIKKHFDFNKGSVTCKCGNSMLTMIFHMNRNPIYNKVYKCENCGNQIGLETYYDSPYY